MQNQTVGRHRHLSQLILLLDESLEGGAALRIVHVNPSDLNRRSVRCLDLNLVGQVRIFTTVLKLVPMKLTKGSFPRENGNLGRSNQTVHCFSHKPEASVLVHVVVLAIGQCLTIIFHLRLFQAITVINYVKSFSTLVQEPDLNRLSVVLICCVLNKLYDPHSELAIQVFYFDI